MKAAPKQSFWEWYAKLEMRLRKENYRGQLDFDDLLKSWENEIHPVLKALLMCYHKKKHKADKEAVK